MKTQELYQKYKKHIDLIWEIANLLRGPYRPPQYRRVMLPMIVLRRLDSVLEPHSKEVRKKYLELKEQGLLSAVIEKKIDHDFNLNFHNTSEFTFNNLLNDPNELARNLGNYIAGFSSKARDILQKFKFEEEIEKLDEANRLFELVKKFKDVDLHPDRIPNMAMGYIFEDLVRRFNEQANEEAGDHFTPREVIKLMVHLLYTKDEDIYKKGIARKIYDPTCGTGGMLSVSEEYINEHNPDANLELYGQEYNPESYAICGSDLLIKGENVDNIVFGDTLGDGKTDDGLPDHKFHYMLANPPFGVEWKPEKNEVTSEHNELGFRGRFGPGLPRINDGALLFLLHMMSKMQPTPEQKGTGSRIAIVFNGSPLFTGDAGSGESNIRRWIIEKDYLETVVALPDQLFYNTGIYTYVWIVTNRKSAERKGKVQLINATDYFVKMKKSLGDKRNEIGDGDDGKPNHIAKITRMYGEFTETEHSKIFDNHEFGYLKMTVERPKRFNFQVNEQRIGCLRRTAWFLELAISKKRKNREQAEQEEAAGRLRQQEILRVVEAITDDTLYKSRTPFENMLKEAFKGSTEKWSAKLRDTLIDAFAEEDKTAEPFHNAKGELVPDPKLRDTENVDLPMDIALPLPLTYPDKKNKGKIDNTELLELVKDHCEQYLKDEVLPYRDDAWIDHSKTKVGYEIPFNRHFYQYQPPRPLSDIEADIKGLEDRIVKMLAEVV
ncbi:type I restriction-modification system subunit M [Endozoicomonas gorgoniicola]|uniref:site-specific DNA-methyltransferase (adenine-specific) n=1 Tax=Endozoicomonas gorgoniicola TaxID=1234144 RepID=A0ABT3N2P2_9GAMM|nr:class I SAM-dependent DNA methyltransferase [Endozoicomonas gorgoniicola]MCW7555908.1 type I restriction-modification system subunit M [Endozoicomonas gorgoniicola]